MQVCFKYLLLIKIFMEEIRVVVKLISNEIVLWCLSCQPSGIAFTYLLLALFTIAINASWSQAAFKVERLQNFKTSDLRGRAAEKAIFAKKSSPSAYMQMFMVSNCSKL